MNGASTALPALGGTPSLEQLRDLQLPPAIGLWPPAPGWWVLAALLVGGIIWAGWWSWRRWRRNRYRRAALKLLTGYRQALPRHDDRQRYLTELSALLRRTALAAYPDQGVAGLTDQTWRQFLIRSSGLDAFDGPDGTVLVNGPYQPFAEYDPDALQQLVAAWIRRHRRRGPC